MSVNIRSLKNVNIARVSTVTFFVQTQLREQIISLVKAGAEVTVVASEKQLVPTIPDSHYVSIEIPRKINLIKDMMALFKLWKLFRRSDFKIVHSSTPKAGLLSAIAAKLAGVPIRLHTFTGQPWVELSGFKHFLSKSSDKLIVLLNTHCYTDSASQKKFLIQKGVSSDKGLTVLGSGSLAGIDTKRFNPSRFSDVDKVQLRTELGIRHSGNIILFVGRISRDKGVFELLEAFSKVAVEHINTFLIMLGPSDICDEELQEKLPIKLKEKLILPGFSNIPERYMAIADFLVLPSYREGFGTVVIEAAAMGIPTIGTNIYGLSDAIIDGETGVLVPVKDSSQLAIAIKLLLTETNYRVKLGDAAASRVKKEFTKERLNKLMTDEYLRFLERLAPNNERI